MPLVAIIGTLGAEAAAAAAAGTAAASAASAAAASAAAAAAPAAAAAAAPAAAGLAASTAAPAAAGLASSAPTLGGMTAAEIAGGAGANAGIMSGEVAAAQAAGAGAGTGMTAAGTPTATGASMVAEQNAMQLPPNAFPNPNAAQFTNAIPAGPEQGIASNLGGQGSAFGTSLTEAGTAVPGSIAETVPSGMFEGVTTGLQKGISSAMKFTKDYPLLSTMGINAASTLMTPRPSGPEKKKYKGYTGNFQASQPSTAVYNPIYQPTAYAVGGPVEQMAAQNAVGQNTGYPMAGLQTSMYSNPQVQRPMGSNVVDASGDVGVDPYTGEQKFALGGGVDTEAAQAAYNRKLLGIKNEQEKADTMETLKGQNAKGMTAGRKLSKIQESYSPFTAANKEYAALAKKYGIPVAPMPKTSVDVSGSTEDADFANGGITYGLGGYSDGGRLLKGPGDGVSDSIPAVIGDKQPARLADGEFVIPARIVSELGNGSTEAGARQLYAMMERIQKGRKKSIGKGKVAVNSKANKHLPK